MVSMKRLGELIETSRKVTLHCVSGNIFYQIAAFCQKYWTVSKKDAKACNFAICNLALKM